MLSRNEAVPLSPVELLVFQGTPFCNIDCSYCYLPGRFNKARLSVETVRQTCRNLRRHDLIAEQTTVLWHSGEPLVLPPSFYEEAFAAIDAELDGLAVSHSIQTNATLIDRHWVDVFKRWGVDVGVSLDGPARLHDRHRQTRSGAPTFDLVIAGIRNLQEAGLPVRIVCVLTRDSIGEPDELFAFFEGLGADLVCFNIDEAGGEHRASSYADASPDEAFRKFLSRYFELVASARSKQEVRELTRGLMYIFAGEIERHPETVPIRTLTVGHDGSFSTFSPDLKDLHHPEFGPFVLGNIHDPMAFTGLAANPRLTAMVESIGRGIDACARSCGYFPVCKGGVPANKLGEHKTFEATETLACRFKRKAVADVVTELLITGKLQPLSGATLAPGAGHRS